MSLTVETVMDSPPPTPEDEESRKFRDIFEQYMPSSTKPISHDSTAVLMLSYDSKEYGPKAMDVSKEVNRLGNVFRNEYKFKVVEKLIPKRNPTLQLLQDLSTFANENDGGHALLIVYYAGHAWRSDDIRRITGFDLLPEGREYLRTPETKAMWDVAEKVLHEVNCDVLVIMDCCDAGYTSTFRSPGHAFEYLGACQEKKFTHGPGKNSFTSALIWALRKLNSGEPFTTATLREKIKQYGEFPPDQEPILFPRNRNFPEHIWISRPTPKGTSSPVKRKRPSNAPEFRDENCSFIDFRLSFSRHLNSNDARMIARLMSPLVTNGELDINARHVEVLQKSSFQNQGPKSPHTDDRWRKMKALGRTSLFIRRWRLVDEEIVEGEGRPRKVPRIELDTAGSGEDASEIVQVLTTDGSCIALDPITPPSRKMVVKDRRPQTLVPNSPIGARSDGLPTHDVEMDERVLSPSSGGYSPLTEVTLNSHGDLEERSASAVRLNNPSNAMQALVGDLDQIDPNGPIFAEILALVERSKKGV